MNAVNWFSPWTTPKRDDGYFFRPEQLGLRALYDYRSADATGFYDQSGNGLAQATVGAGGNSPLWVPYTVPQVYLPVSGNRITTTGTSFPTTDLDVWGEITSADWTPSTAVVFIERMGGDPNRSFQLMLNTTGTVSLLWYPLGTNASMMSVTTTATLEAVSGVAVNGVVAVRATLDVDNGAGGHTVSFYYRLGGTDGPWTYWQTIVTAGTTNLPVVSRPIELGGAGAGGGTVPIFMRRARMLSSIGGSVLVDFNAAFCGQSGYTDTVGSAGAVWNITRAATGYKAVVQSFPANSAKSLFLLATDDWIDVPAAAVPALDTYAAASSVIAVFRRWHNPGTAGHAIFTTKANVANTALGAAIRLDTTAGLTTIVGSVGDAALNDGTSLVGANAPALGARAVVRMTVGSASPFMAISADLLTVGNDTVRGTAVSTSTGGAGRIGAYTGGTGAIDMEFEALLTANRAFTAAEIAQIVAFYGGGL